MPQQIKIHIDGGQTVTLDATGEDLVDVQRIVQGAIGADSTGFISGWTPEGVDSSWIAVPGRVIHGVVVEGFERTDG